MWQFMELYNGTLGQHGFCVCHPGRAETGYKIDFSGNAFMNYVPVLRSREVPPKEAAPEGCIAIQRDSLPAYTLSPASSALFKQIDGKKSIRDCFKEAKLASQEAETVCRMTFQYLWRLSYIFLRIPS